MNGIVLRKRPVPREYGVNIPRILTWSDSRARVRNSLSVTLLIASAILLAMSLAIHTFSQGQNDKHAKTEIYLKNIKNMIEHSGLKKLSLFTLTDAWQNPLYIEQDRGILRLISLGADQNYGGEGAAADVVIEIDASNGKP